MNHWIQYKFRFNDDPVNSDWWMDLFLIDTAFRDIIEKHKPELWRFHRRSGKDSVGHQLSLLVYTDRKTASKISMELVDHYSIRMLAENNRIKSNSIEIMEPGIEKTSDANWSESLQKSWPYFACGTCQMILGLMADIPKFEKPKIDHTYEEYEFLHNDMKDLYTDNASHVFIHHISALFGYAPIKLRI